MEESKTKASSRAAPSVSRFRILVIAADPSAERESRAAACETMATRRQAMIPQQHPVEVVQMGKGKNAAAADGKSRRALGDIGNVFNVRVKEGKPEAQINRPITRSFGAKLLLNAQAAAASQAAAAKKPAATKPDIPVPRDGAKPQKKVAVKCKEEKIEEKVIEKNSDDNGKSKQDFAGKSYRRKDSGKRITGLTSVLTARSKVACGLTDNEPIELVPDIDAADKEDQLAVADYVEDIYKFYKSAQDSSSIRDYMDSQVELNANMRSILADWLIEVHHRFELTPETLYLTFYIIDRYLSMETVLRRELQLVGMSAMVIASKYEEIWAPEVNDFICISDRAYTREQILKMEKTILNKIEWNLTVPTPYVFLVRFVKAAACNSEEQHMVFFFAELALMEYSMLKYCSSMVAAAAVYAARCTLKKSPLWTQTLKCHTGYSEQELLDCKDVLVNAHAAAPQGKLKSIYMKYSGQEFAAVALHSPATQCKV